jgi:hypothetical protein
LAKAIGIAILNFVHETVTFLPNDTALDDFVHDGLGLVYFRLQRGMLAMCRVPCLRRAGVLGRHSVH